VTRPPYAPERRRRRPAPPIRPPWRPPTWAVYAERVLVTALVIGGAWLGTSSLRAARPGGAAFFQLPPVAAVGVSMDTVFFGGFARGSFAEALETVAELLEPGEREMLGQHLDRIFARPLRGQGLGTVGRLRGGVERTLRPDGTTRALRVLAAEAAVAGVLHTAFFYELDGQPSYFDAAGRSLDAAAWSPPLESSRVSSPFGSRRMHPILGRVLPHSGADYAAPSGTPVRAAADGSVARAGWAGGYGILVEIIHPDGQTTRYAHLQRIDPSVRRGGFVRRGQVIGAVGMTGLATGPHLHFEIRRQGVAVDPERALRETGTSLRVSHEAGWPAAREELSILLARSPTVLRRNAGGAE